MQLDIDVAKVLANQFAEKSEAALAGPLQEARGISRQAATAMLGRLVRNGLLSPGTGQKPKTYFLRNLANVDKSFELAGLEEHVVWVEHLKPLLADHVTPEALNIWEYGVTEMINNAIDHSQGSTLRVQLYVNAAYSSCYITDDGEGIFKRITRLCKLPDERQAILELAKGKLTTDPSKHSGEGIFFSSRAFDYYRILSCGLTFDHVHDKPDLMIEHGPIEVKGTTVFMRHGNARTRALREVFDQFAEPDEYTFSKTVVPVRLAKMGAESLVSRSQAQRLLARIDRFKTVVLDFDGVETIGQAFADEIFRVFHNAHPDVELIHSKTNEQILGMIRRAQAHDVSEQQGHLFPPTA